MAHKNIEIEIHVKIENNDALMKFLQKNAVFQSEKHQLDEYFTPAHRNFIGVRPVNEWLRLRDSGGKYFISYKNWQVHSDGKIYSCTEYETGIDSIEQLRKIFSALDLTTVVVVDKQRQTWIYRDYEIAVDSVKNLGDYVEIEYIGKNEHAEPKKITQEMIKFLKTTGCGKITRNYSGYAFELLFPDEVKPEIQ